MKRRNNAQHERRLRRQLIRRRARFDATRQRAQAASRSSECGFTLIEMMVSIALTVLMMLMFTEIFQVFTGTMGKQKGIGSNDQRTRTLTTVIRGDFDKRTFRILIPFGGNESQLGPLFQMARGDLDSRQGYFYISENDPSIDTDDVIQFTVRSTILLKNQDESPYYGRAVLIASKFERNQPIWDDGDVYTEDQNDDFILQPAEDVNMNGKLDSNNSSSSTEAEVVYFLRAGNLYRRTMLIRKPPASVNGQPRSSNGFEFFARNNNGMGGRPPLYSGEFWRDFDFSAYYSPVGLRFNSTDSLNNNYFEPGFTSTPLAMPSYRFGFAHFEIGNTDYAGQPREFIGTGAARRFIGRFTHKETSDPDFDYPFDITSDPMNRNATTALTMNSQGAVEPFHDGLDVRRGEDILMTNVHSFDVKVWDEGVQQFVDIGHNLYESDIDGNPAFDAANEDLNGNGTNDPRGHFHRLQNANPGYGPTLIPSGGSAPGINNVFDTWHPHIDLVTSEDVNANGRLDPPQDLNGNGMIDPDEPQGEDTIIVNDRIDSFRGDDGLVDSPPYRPLDAKGNVLPIKAIQIKIRFKDTKSDQMRQLTIIHSMLK